MVNAIYEGSWVVIQESFFTKKFFNYKINKNGTMTYFI